MINPLLVKRVANLYSQFTAWLFTFSLCVWSHRSSFNVVAFTTPPPRFVFPVPS